MRLPLAIVMLLASLGAHAECESSLPLEGSIGIDTCDPAKGMCRDSTEALYAYMQNIEDDDTVVTVAVQSSPWRMYDAQMRVLSVEDMVVVIRRSLTKKAKRVRLIGSWTGVAPDPRTPSLAEQVSGALNGFPVDGMEGFLWVSKDGELRTTQQAFTVRNGSGPYFVREGEDVMTALTSGWLSDLEDRVIENGDAEGAKRAAAGWDIYHLCPDHALRSFERAASLGSAVAGYNAASIRLDRAKAGDKEAAIALLSRAAELGDEKARIKLSELQAADRKSGEPRK
jgi:hypothetical protein